MISRTLHNADYFSLVEEELKDVGRVRIRVKGNSMYPLLRDGVDEVNLRRVDRHEPIRKGEIYLFRTAGKYVLHRCIELQGDKCHFRGDNTCFYTEWSEREDVRALVEQVFRKRGSTYVEARQHSLYWRFRCIVRRFRCVLLSVCRNSQ